ncbi:MAG: DUF4388 domain-containing protein [Acidobacteriota bacterium]
MREALEELQSYFSDNLPPLLASDSFLLLLEQPPAVMLEGIQGWVGAQFRVLGGRSRVSDYLFHTVKKLHMMGELHLAPDEALREYLVRLAELVVPLAPEEERETLRQHLGRLEEGQSTAATGVSRLQQPGSGPGPTAAASPAAELSPQELRGLRRFSLLLERLAPEPGAAPREVTPELLTAAIESAHSGSDLRQYLAKVGLGEAGAGEAMRALSRGLPGWLLSREEGAPAYESAPATAMRRIVGMAEDSATSAERFREMLRAAIEQTNAGELGRAVAIIDAARRVVEDHQVEKGTSDLIRGSLGDAFDTQRLLELVREREHHAPLRNVLGFFTAFTPEGVFERLTNEPDRQRRKLWLALAEMWGPRARELALERLEQSLAEPLLDRNAWWHQRNFVFLLYRIPPPRGEVSERELQVIVQLSGVGQAMALLRECVVYLGLVPGGRGVPTLLARLGEIERMLLDEKTPPARDPGELDRLLNHVCSSLIRAGTPAARRAVIEHGLRQQPRLGDTLSRLTELGGSDLTADEASIDRLLEALQGFMPRRVLGVVVQRHELGMVSVIEALAGTQDRRVREALLEISRRFAGEVAGRAASQALEARAAPRRPAPLPEPEEADEEAAAAAMEVVAPEAAPAARGGGLQGDLELFGLPELLQSLAARQSTGELVLRDAGGLEVGRLWLVGGKLADCLVGHRRGEAAFYQLHEEPRAGAFEFFRREPGEIPAGFGPADPLALVFEAMRRHDELQRARALVADDAVLKPTGARPTPPPDESDGALVRDVWTRVRDGATPREVEAGSAADSFRVRGMLAHWLEERVLERAAGGAR